MPGVQAAVTAVQQTDVGKTIKHEINTFSQSIPVFMRALDELKTLHPFIGGEFVLRYTCIHHRVTVKTVVVLAFKAAYKLEHNRHENDKKVIALYVAMKDMMGVLLL
jgi:hypothetical protein